MRGKVGPDGVHIESFLEIRRRSFVYASDHGAHEACIADENIEATERAFDFIRELLDAVIGARVAGGDVDVDIRVDMVDF